MAIAAKPWGVVAVPLVLALDGAWRWKALAIAAGIGAVAWLPFVLADPGTLDTVKPAVITDEASVLHLFGLSLTEPPSWVRPVQLGAAIALGATAALRGRWAAVLLVGIAMRLALDPRAFLYYSVGLAMAALAWDLLRSRHPLPVYTLVTFLLLNNAYLLVDDPGIRAALRLAITVTVVATAIVTGESALSALRRRP
jgi:hypothetical protein